MNAFVSAHVLGRLFLKSELPRPLVQYVIDCCVDLVAFFSDELKRADCGIVTLLLLIHPVFQMHNGLSGYRSNLDTGPVFVGPHGLQDLLPPPR
eukprot:8973448-Pyramimonas_sp.AAC.1